MKSYIIYLPNYTSSVLMATNTLNSGTTLGWDLELFQGVDGQTVATDNNWAKHNVKFNETDKKCRKMLDRPGVRGCFLSHWYLWNVCITNDAPIGIFEHDITFLKPPIFDLNFEDVLKLENLGKQKSRPAGVWYQGATGYIIKPAGAKKLKEWIHTNGCLPADVVMGENVVSLAFDNNNLIAHPVQSSRLERHTNSFTWNIEGMK